MSFYSFNMFQFSRDQVKTPKPRGRPKNTEKGSIKKVDPVNSSRGSESGLVDVAELGIKELMVLLVKLSEPYGVSPGHKVPC